MKLAYVSLNGIDTIDDVDDALFRATYQIVDNKVVRIAGRAAKAAFKYMKFEMDIKDLLNKTDADVLVFDDLERCDLPIQTILGYINGFVEHEHRKVIIIAHEAEIKGDYGRVREKLIGRTFDVQSVFDQAIEAFFTSMQDDAAQAFLRSKRNEIAQIFEQSQSQNLRILQQAMWDFERFFVAIRADHRANEKAITSLMVMLLALSFELRSGRLTHDDLLQHQSNYVSSFIRSRSESTPPTRFETAKSRYPHAELDSAALSDHTLADFLIKGLVDHDRIREDLDASSFFVKIGSEPAWRTVWYAFERSDEEFDAALASMEHEFVERKYIDLGVLLHVFGLRLWLSDIGSLQVPRLQVVEECKIYVDDLYKSKSLEPAPIGSSMGFMAYQGYAGLGIFENETSDFQDLFSYMTEKRQLARIDLYPKIAAELLENMIADHELFSSRVSFKDGSAGEFYRIPVLASLAPSKFAESFLKLHPAHQRSVLIALYIRYDSGHIDRDLADEKPWACQVRKLLLDASFGMRPVARRRTTSNIAYALDKVLPTEA